jgi:dTDP-4-dehydrorhamnose 3,5-epimerase
MNVEIIKEFHDQPVLLFKPDIFYDFRGEYFETYHKDQYSKEIESWCGKTVNFICDDISTSTKNTLRGLHGDTKTWKLIQCLYGTIFVAIVDMRKENRTFLNHKTFTLSDKNRYQLLVPPNFVNGHLVLSDSCIFSYKQSEYYGGIGSQMTINALDPELGIMWPSTGNLIRSERDTNADFIFHG